MSRLAQVEADVPRMSPGELAAFRAWFAAFDAEFWVGSHADYDALIR